MEIAELLKGLKKYKEILNEAYLEIRLFDDGSGIIVNEDKKNIYCFDTAEEALQDLFECKKCSGKGVVEVETSYILNDEYGRPTTIKQLDTDTCQKCNGKGYVIPK